jgi:uncharacterized protein DUF2510
MSFEQRPTERPTRGRGLIISGSAIIVISLIVGIVSGVLIARAVAGPVGEMFSNPVRQTPVDASLPFEAGEYTIFEKTGSLKRTGPVTTSEDDPPTLTAEDIRITGPGGRTIKASDQFGGDETVTRNQAVFTAAAHFRVPVTGDYRVRVTPADKEIVIAATLSSGLRPALKWGAGIATSALALMIGVVLLIVGLVQRSRARRTQPGRHPQPMPNAPLPPSGWYPAPDTPGRQRYWDGRAWTDQLR